MARNARVAVIIPAFNHEGFVDEAVRSVLDQTWTDFELLIIDDGSTDGTAERCRAWVRRDDRVRFISQANAGSHATLNRGIDQTSADVVAILNSDDRWAPHRLQQVVDVMQDPDARFVVTGVRLIDGEGSPIDDPQHWWNRTQRDFGDQVRQHGAAMGLLHGNYTVSTSNFVLRRSLWREVGPFRPRRMIPDWDWAVRAAVVDPRGIRHLADQALLDYRLHGSNAILTRIVRGDLEIARLHRWMLGHLGVPGPAINALFRAQRDLRRHAAAHVQSTLEPIVRQREADAALLTAQVQEGRAVLVLREKDVQTLHEQISQVEKHVRDREADVASLRRAMEEAEAFVRARETDIRLMAERHAQSLEELRLALAHAEDFVRAREADVRLREAEVQALTQQLAAAEGYVRAREADLESLRVEIDSLTDRHALLVQELRLALAAAEGYVRARELDIAALHLELDGLTRQHALALGEWRQSLTQAEGFVRAREADVRSREAEVQALANQLSAAEQFLRVREQEIAELSERAAQAERFVADREHDLRTWRSESAALESFLRQREADVQVLQTALGLTEGHLRDRQSDVLTLQSHVSRLQTDLATMEGLASDRQDQIARLEAQRQELQALVDEADSSWIWRQVRRLRRRFGLRRI